MEILKWITLSIAFIGGFYIFSIILFYIKSLDIYGWLAAIIGSPLETQLTIKTNPKTLKIIFASTSMLAALIMIIKIFI